MQGTLLTPIDLLLAQEVAKARSSSSSFPMVAIEEEQDDQDKELMAELTKGLSAPSSSVQLTTKGSAAQQPCLHASGERSRETVPEKMTADTGMV